MVSSLKEEYATIVGLGGEVLCVSSDGIESHEAFCEEMGGCPFPIATDPNGEVAETYGARAEGQVTGVRAVYVLDADGTVALRIPWYQPGNIGQFMEVFQALGLE